jgi:hypothetical protein
MEVSVMASIHERLVPAHLVVVVYDEDGQVESGWDPTAERYRAECSCGWFGDWQLDGALAEADGEDHREVVVGPGDGLDRLMGELLDLQDDLARAVIWLAEHWSADLPVPRLRGVNRSEVAGVDLIAYCYAPEVLERAAGLLEVPLVNDAVPDSYGGRYRRAVRPFGRVRLEVYRSIAPVCSGCGTEVDGDVCGRCGQRVDARTVTVEVA